MAGDGLDGPFRGTAIARWSPTRRTTRAWTGWTLVAAMGMSVAGAAVAESMLGYWFGGIGGALLAMSWRYARARRGMTRLPFAVRHQPHPPGTFTMNPVSICQVQIALAEPLMPSVLDGALADLATQQPLLVIRARRDAVSLTGWCWASRDLEVLDSVLESWGRQLHELGTITEVAVTWDGY